MSTRGLLCRSGPLVDIFSFLLLPMAQFRLNDASVDVRASGGILTPRDEEGPGFAAAPSEGRGRS